MALFKSTYCSIYHLLTVALMLAGMNSSLAAKPLCDVSDSTDTETVMLQTDNVKSTVATLNDIEWILGHWTGCFEGGLVDFVVLSENHGQLPGYARGYGENYIWFYEILSFNQESDSLTFYVKHFDADFKTREPDDGRLAHQLLKIEPGIAYFDRHTFKQDGNDNLDMYYKFPDGDRAGEITHVRYTRGTRK